MSENTSEKNQQPVEDPEVVAHMFDDLENEAPVPPMCPSYIAP